MSTAVQKAARPWHRKKRYNVPLGILVSLMVIGAFSEDTTKATETKVDPEPSAEASATQSATPTRVAGPRPKPRRTYVVSRVIDGDTVELGTGDDVRIVGIDTPERGECGYAEATANMVRLVAGKRVRLGISDEDHDRYGRLLRYVDIGAMDAGLRQIKNGLAIARYDSRDGYGEHPREARYIAADRGSPNRSSCPPKPKQEPRPKPKPKPKPQGGSCAPGYQPCLPVVGDLDCADVDGPIYVTGSDPYALDRENDGVGCES